MTLPQFQKALQERKACTGFFNVAPDIRMPAAFINSMQFGIVANALPRLKVYKPTKRKNK